MYGPTRPDAQVVPAPHGARAPRDLEPWEAEVAGWVALLGRADAPVALRARLLGALAGPPAAAAGPRFGWAVRVAGRLAVAAALLLALGLGVFDGAARRARGEAARAPVTGSSRAALLGAAGEVVVVDDPSIPLFHALETFGGGELAGLDGSPGSGR